MINLMQQWQELKAMEAEIKQKRYEVETKIALTCNYDALSGKSKTLQQDGFKIGFTPQKEKKVDYEKLKKIQSQYQIPQSEIDRLFKLKPSVVSDEFKKLDAASANIINGAITVNINKPTLKITKLGE